MAKYEMLIAASGKRGSALLPCVVVDEKGIKRADERDKAAQIFTWCMVVAMTRKRALEPHAWSGPVMRCTSFSSGIGQKS